MAPKLIQVRDQFGGQLPSDFEMRRVPFFIFSWVVWNHLGPGILEVRGNKFRHGEQPEPGALPSHSPSFADANRGIQSESLSARSDFLFWISNSNGPPIKMGWKPGNHVLKGSGRLFSYSHPLAPVDDLEQVTNSFARWVRPGCGDHQR